MLISANLLATPNAEDYTIAQIGEKEETLGESIKDTLGSFFYGGQLFYRYKKLLDTYQQQAEKKIDRESTLELIAALEVELERDKTANKIKIISLLLSLHDLLIREGVNFHWPEKEEGVKDWRNGSVHLSPEAIVQIEHSLGKLRKLRKILKEKKISLEDKLWLSYHYDLAYSKLLLSFSHEDPSEAIKLLQEAQKSFAFCLGKDNLTKAVGKNRVVWLDRLYILNVAEKKRQEARVGNWRAGKNREATEKLEKKIAKARAAYQQEIAKVKLELEKMRRLIPVIELVASKDCTVAELLQKKFPFLPIDQQVRNAIQRFNPERQSDALIAGDKLIVPKYLLERYRQKTDAASWADFLSKKNRNSFAKLTKKELQQLSNPELIAYLRLEYSRWRDDHHLTADELLLVDIADDWIIGSNNPMPRGSAWQLIKQLGEGKFNFSSVLNIFKQSLTLDQALKWSNNCRQLKLLNRLWQEKIIAKDTVKYLLEEYILKPKIKSCADYRQQLIELQELLTAIGFEFSNYLELIAGSAKELHIDYLKTFSALLKRWQKSRPAPSEAMPRPQLIIYLLNNWGVNALSQINHFEQKYYYLTISTLDDSSANRAIELVAKEIEINKVFRERNIEEFLYLLDRLFALDPNFPQQDVISAIENCLLTKNFIADYQRKERQAVRVAKEIDLLLKRVGFYPHNLELILAGREDKLRLLTKIEKEKLIEIKRKRKAKNKQLAIKAPLKESFSADIRSWLSTLYSQLPVADEASPDSTSDSVGNDKGEANKSAGGNFLTDALGIAAMLFMSQVPSLGDDQELSSNLGQPYLLRANSLTPAVGVVASLDPLDIKAQAQAKIAHKIWRAKNLFNSHPEPIETIIGYSDSKKVSYDLMHRFDGKKWYKDNNAPPDPTPLLAEMGEQSKLFLWRKFTNNSIILVPENGILANIYNLPNNNFSLVKDNFNLYDINLQQLDTSYQAIKSTYYLDKVYSQSELQAKEEAILNYYQWASQIEMTLPESLMALLEEEDCDRPFSEFANLEKLTICLTTIEGWVENNIFYSDDDYIAAHYQYYFHRQRQGKEVRPFIDFVLNLGAADCDVHNTIFAALVNRIFRLPTRLVLEIIGQNFGDNIGGADDKHDYKYQRQDGYPFSKDYNFYLDTRRLHAVTEVWIPSQGWKIYDATAYDDLRKILQNSGYQRLQDIFADKHSGKKIKKIKTSLEKKFKKLEKKIINKCEFDEDIYQVAKMLSVYYGDIYQRRADRAYLQCLYSGNWNPYEYNYQVDHVKDLGIVVGNVTEEEFLDYSQFFDDFIISVKQNKREELDDVRKSYVLRRVLLEQRELFYRLANGQLLDQKLWQHIADGNLNVAGVFEDRLIAYGNKREDRLIAYGNKRDEIAGINLTDFYGSEENKMSAIALNNARYCQEFLKEKFLDAYTVGEVKDNVFLQTLYFFRDNCSRAQKEAALPLILEYAKKGQSYRQSEYGLSTRGNNKRIFLRNGLRIAEDLGSLALLNFYREVDKNNLWAYLEFPAVKPKKVLEALLSLRWLIEEEEFLSWLKDMEQQIKDQLDRTTIARYLSSKILYLLKEGKKEDPLLKKELIEVVLKFGLLGDHILKVAVGMVAAMPIDEYPELHKKISKFSPVSGARRVRFADYVNRAKRQGVRQLALTRGEKVTGINWLATVLHADKLFDKEEKALAEKIYQQFNDEEKEIVTLLEEGLRSGGNSQTLPYEIERQVLPRLAQLQQMALMSNKEEVVERVTLLSLAVFERIFADGQTLGSESRLNKFADNLGKLLVRSFASQLELYTYLEQLYIEQLSCSYLNYEERQFKGKVLEITAKGADLRTQYTIAKDLFERLKSQRELGAVRYSEASYHFANVLSQINVGKFQRFYPALEDDEEEKQYFDEEFANKILDWLEKGGIDSIEPLKRLTIFKNMLVSDSYDSQRVMELMSNYWSIDLTTSLSPEQRARIAADLYKAAHYRQKTYLVPFSQLEPKAETAIGDPALDRLGISLKFKEDQLDAQKCQELEKLSGLKFCHLSDSNY